jgi:hypothetical protein
MLIVAITLTLAGLLVSSYHDTIAREQTNLRNLAEAFAAQTHYATLALDLALAHAAERTPAGGALEAIPARAADRPRSRWRARCRPGRPSSPRTSPTSSASSIRPTWAAAAPSPCTTWTARCSCAARPCPG